MVNFYLKVQKKFLISFLFPFGKVWWSKALILQSNICRIKNTPNWNFIKPFKVKIPSILVNKFHPNPIILGLFILSFLFNSNNVVGQDRSVVFGSASEYGSYNWEVPCGVTEIKILVWGAGGAGGGVRNNNNENSGGGGGGAFSLTILPVTPGTIYKIVVGAGGMGDLKNGDDGLTSSFESLSGSILAFANGGGGGKRGLNGGAGGARGMGGFEYVYLGGSGADGSTAGGGGGGGSSATVHNSYGYGVNGINSTNSIGATFDPTGVNGGNGGNGKTGPNGRGNNGSWPGAGGGGSRSSNGDHYFGGDGGNGKVEIRYNGAPSAYCYADFNNSEPITYVNFGGIANTTSPNTSNVEANSYQNFCLTAEVSQGANYPIIVKGNTNGNDLNYVTVFIDWNQDGSFNGANEIYKIGTLLNTTGTDLYQINSNIAVPANAVLGKTQMRVYKYYRNNSNTVNNAFYETNACNRSWSFGQIEDYIVNVSGACKPPTSVTATVGTNAPVTGSITVCTETTVTLKQVGGAISSDQNWAWSKSCGGALENPGEVGIVTSDAALNISFDNPGTTTFYVWPRGGSCGVPSSCQSITVTSVKPGIISVNNPFNKDFSVCKTVASATVHATFSIGGGATSVTASGLPAGLIGILSGSFGNYTYTISGTPTAAVANYNYTITTNPQTPCSVTSITGSITVTNTPTVSYTGATYCIGGKITDNTPIVITGGAATTFAISPLSITPNLPLGLSLDLNSGIISGTPSGPTGSFSYQIRASNSCGFTDAAAFTIIISAGNTIFDITPSGSTAICSTSSGVSIGLSGSVININYQLYLNNIPVAGATAVGTGFAFSFASTINTPGTYTVVATSNCATTMNGSLILSVTPTPTATISYSAGTYCKSAVNPLPTISGTPMTGGYFTASPAGLVFTNASTGEINLASSGIGSYAITYNVPNLGGCLAYISPSVSVIVANALSTYNVTGGGEYCSPGAGFPVGLNNSESITYQLWRNGAYTGTSLNSSGGAFTFPNQTLDGTYTILGISGSCSKLMNGSVDIVVNTAPAPISVTPSSPITMCQGSIQPLTATSGNPNTTSNALPFASGTITQTITDNSASGTFYQFKVSGIPAGATITGVSLDFYITHNNISDLTLNLKGPNGNVLNIVDRIGGTNDNYGSTTQTVLVNSTTTNPLINTASHPYTGPYSPHAAGGVAGITTIPEDTSNVASFSGLYGATAASANGNWYFTARDKVGNSVGGTLRYCRLIINYTLVNNPTVVTWSPITDLYTDPGATVPYLTGTSASTVYVKPSTSGPKTYSSRLGNGTGCFSTSDVSLKVTPSPTITMKADYCSVAGKVRITAESNVAIATGGWLWNTGVSGTIIGNKSYIDVNVAGTYYVSAKAASGSCPGTGVMSIAQELVTNGDFEIGGYTGFTSDYNYYPDDPTRNDELVPDQGYDGFGVGEDGQFYHGNFWGWDHTFGTGLGKYMLVNGHGSSLVVWKNTNVTVRPNTDYYFSGWVLSLNNAGNDAELKFRINGANVGISATPDLGIGSPGPSSANKKWKKFHGVWPSGSATSADIYIVNLQNAAGGNDFGLDDISFGTLTAFFNLVSPLASDNQTTKCVGKPIDEIIYEIGGDGNAPITSGSLPAGVSTYWNGRTFRISGIPISSGNFIFNIQSTGCAPQTKTVKINVAAASNAGSFTAPIVSACYGTGGSISVAGSAATSYSWESSLDGVSSWGPVAGSPNAATYNYPGLTSAIYYRVKAQNTAACDIATSPVVKLGLKNVWAGNTNDLWNTATNWSDEQLPSLAPCTSVIIPNVIPNGKPLPILNSGIAAVKNLIIDPSASLLIKNDAVLQVGGAIISPIAAITATSGTIQMNGAADQSLSGKPFVGNKIKNLIISGAKISVPITAPDSINILSKLSFNSTSDLETGDNITLKSNALETASVGELKDGNIVTGKFVIERFINYYQNWNLVSSPTAADTLKVKYSWQEGGLIPSPASINGYGTQITGPGGLNGLDANSIGYSMKAWDALNGNWHNVNSTTTETVNRKSGFYLFVRGDRRFGPGAAGSKTVLRTKGIIYDYHKNPSYSVTVPAATYISIGNPYASSVSLDKFVAANNLDLEDNFWLWDPSLSGSYGVGGYQTVTRLPDNTFITTPAYTDVYTDPLEFKNIQSGQAVFVRSFKANPTINFAENMKEDGSMLVTRGSGSNEPVQMLSTMLYTSAGLIRDGNRIILDDDYSDAVDKQDALKLNNSGVNFGLVRNNKNLAVEFKTPLKSTDTLFYKMSGIPNGEFKLQVSVQNIQTTGLSAEMIDKFLATRTPVSLVDATTIPFTTSVNAASKAADRFMMVFKPAAGPLPVTLTGISANRNTDRSIAIRWTVENEVNIEKYEVERSADGRNFTGIISSDATNSNVYTKNDLSPLANDNFYRIKALTVGGYTQYSAIVKVAPLQELAAITVFPNPVVDQRTQIKFVNQPAGTYEIKLYNQSGQLMQKENVKVSGTSFVKTYVLNNNFAGGVYQLNILNPDGSSTVQQLIIK